jgi:hypothetical protein
MLTGLSKTNVPVPNVSAVPPLAKVGDVLYSPGGQAALLPVVVQETEAKEAVDGFEGTVRDANGFGGPPAR